MCVYLCENRARLSLHLYKSHPRDSIQIILACRSRARAIRYEKMTLVCRRFSSIAVFSVQDHRQDRFQRRDTHIFAKQEDT